MMTDPFATSSTIPSTTPRPGPFATRAQTTPVQRIVDILGTALSFVTQSGPVSLKFVCGQLPKLCYPNGQLDVNNVQRLRYVLMSLIADCPGLAIFNKVPIHDKYDLFPIDISIQGWSDFCRQMASLPAIEIFVPQALGVLAALSEEPQEKVASSRGQQSEVNLPGLLATLQRCGLGDAAGMQILTELFTPHFQVNDYMCTCHALVNYELMTNPTRLACALVNRTIDRSSLVKASKDYSFPMIGVRPLGFSRHFMPIPLGAASQTMDPSLSHVNRLVAILYQKREEGSPQAVVGRDPTEVLKSYLGIPAEDISPPNLVQSFPFTARVDDVSQSIIYTLPSEAVGSIKASGGVSIATFHCLAPDERGNLSRPGHTCLALQTQNGDIIFHTNYQDTDQDGKVSVFYVGLTGEGVLSKFSLNPDGNFGVQGPYMLSTHTEQAHHGALACLECASLEDDFMKLAHEQFSQCQDSRFTTIPGLITECMSDPTEMPNLMSQIFAILQPKLEILSPPEPPPLPA